MGRAVLQANRQVGNSLLPAIWRTFLIFTSASLTGISCLHSQCPQTGETRVIKPSHGTGFYFYRFLGDGSFRYFLDGKTFSLNDKDDPGRTIVFIDDMAYEMILEDEADFAKYIKGSTPIDILRAQAKYEQDHYKSFDPTLVITDFGPPSDQKPDDPNDRAFYLWKKENPPGKQAATQYLVSTLVKDKVVLLSIMLTMESVTQDDVFRQLQKYTSQFDVVSSEKCAQVLSAPVSP